MTSLETFITDYGPWLGLGIYILISDVIPFLKDKWWPQAIKDKENLHLMRRENDARLADLNEREVIAQEQVAKNLILLNERILAMNADIMKHDEHQMQSMNQMTNTLSAMQSVMNVLLDRVTRPPKTGPLNSN